MWMLFSPFCVQQFLRFSILTWPRSRSFYHDLYLQSTVMFYESGRDACFEIVCVLFVDHVFWCLWLSNREFNSCVFPFIRSVREHSWRCVLLSALLHDQSCLQSSSCFAASVCVAPFFSNPCLQGWAIVCSLVYMGARDSCLRA